MSREELEEKIDSGIQPEDLAREHLVANCGGRGRPISVSGGPAGCEVAVVAVAHTILTTIYHLLRHWTTYCELGSQYFDERDRQATERHLVRRFEVLGNRVTAEPKERPL